MLGFRHALKRGATRPLFLIVYASFVANALEGVIIDTDHWRHFYLLMAIIWGLMFASDGKSRPPCRAFVISDAPTDAWGLNRIGAPRYASRATCSSRSSSASGSA